MAAKQRVIDAADGRALVAVVVVAVLVFVGILAAAVVLGLAVRLFMLCAGLGS